MRFWVLLYIFFMILIFLNRLNFLYSNEMFSVSILKTKTKFTSFYVSLFFCFVFHLFHVSVLKRDQTVSWFQWSIGWFDFRSRYSVRFLSNLWSCRSGYLLVPFLFVTTGVVFVHSQSTSTIFPGFRSIHDRTLRPSWTRGLFTLRREWTFEVTEGNFRAPFLTPSRYLVSVGGNHHVHQTPLVSNPPLSGLRSGWRDLEESILHFRNLVSSNP